MTKKLSYEGAKLQQVSALTTKRIYGQPLDESELSKLNFPKSKFNWIKLIMCNCVQDTPENPCPCYNSPIWWIKSEDIVEQGESDKKDHDGNELSYYDVDINAKVLVESIKSANINSLTRKPKHTKEDLAKLVALIKSKRNTLVSNSNCQKPNIIYKEQSFFDTFVETALEILDAGENASDGEVVEVLCGVGEFLLILL